MSDYLVRGMTMDSFVKVVVLCHPGQDEYSFSASVHSYGQQ